jgi:hypothetical protein
MGERPAKIKITPFKNKELTNQDESVKPYIVPVNPEQYVLNYKIKYDVKPPSGSHGVQERFLASAPEELKLDWIIDGTNTIYGYKFSTDSARSVIEQIQHLKSVVYDMSGEIHQPRFLKIMGLGIHQRGNGDVTFDAILTDLQITYTLFNPSGEPLRAKISATFLDYRENKRRVLEEDKKSPDLTHIRRVKDGEKLPLIVYEAYKDPTYHLEISKVNNLTNFRRLKVGEELVLPPIKKTVN